MAGCRIPALPAEGKTGVEAAVVASGRFLAEEAEEGAGCRAIALPESAEAGSEAAVVAGLNSADEGGLALVTVGKVTGGSTGAPAAGTSQMSNCVADPALVPPRKSGHW